MSTGLDHYEVDVTYTEQVSIECPFCDWEHVFETPPTVGEILEQAAKHEDERPHDD